MPVQLNGPAVGQSSVSGDGTLRRRPMISRQLCPQGAAATVENGVTIAQAASSHPQGPRSYTLSVAATSAAARGFVAQTVTGLDTSAYYALTAEIEEVNRQSGSAWGGWLGFTSAPVEASIPSGTAGPITVDVLPPAIGVNGYIFRPSSSSMTIRVGIGALANATAIAGDKLKIKAISVVRVPGLTTPVPPYANSPLGPVGYDPIPVARQAGSCIFVPGDSWSNGATDWPGLLSANYGREVVASAVAGNASHEILARLNAIKGDLNYLYPPNFNAPGMAWYCGGINDRISYNRSGQEIIDGAKAIIDVLQSLNMRVGIIIQVDCIDSSYYTAARAQAWGQWAQWVMESGYPYVDTRPFLQNANGTANTTNMLSEGGVWVHPSDAGYALIAAAVDAEQRRIDLAGAAGAGRWVA